MIARQRQNLQRTFAAIEIGSPSSATIQRLATTQHELLDATSEFASGAAKFGDVSALQDAVLAMQTAEVSMRNADMEDGQASERDALTSLIRARKNMRKILSMSNASSAAQCRSFDRQQQQKLRPPKQAKQDQEQQLAETREQLEKLAQQQRKWSEDVRGGSSGVELEREPSPEQQQQEQQQQQQQAQSALGELAVQMSQSKAASDHSDREMEKAAESVQESLDKLAANDREAAANAAEDAADRLDELSDMLAALNAADLAEQLGTAQRLAKQLADRQGSVASQMQQQSSNAGKPGSPGQASQGGSRGTETGTSKSASSSQRDVAGATDALAELLARLGAAAEDEDRQLSEAIAELKVENPAQEIAQSMRDAADDFDDGESKQAVDTAREAEESLKAISADLGRVREQFAQPRLEELIAIEEQASELADAYEARKRSEMIDSQVASIEKRLQSLARRDGQLAKALDDLREGENASSGDANATEGGGRGSSNQQDRGPTTAGNAAFQRSPTIMGGGLREVTQVLQGRIQELILATAVNDADDAVPQPYQDLVEQYYRDLSDDLR